MTRADDPRLDGRHPEFARMSLRPGIGLGALDEVAKTLHHFNLDTTQTDVPVSLRHGAKELPLGRYLRRKLRVKLGKPEKAPDEALREYQAQMLDVRLAARSSSENPGIRHHIVEKNRGATASLLARERIYKQRKVLDNG